MKLFRHGLPGQERPGIVAGDGSLRDLSCVVDNLSGAALSAKGRGQLAGIDASALPRVPQGTRFGPCVGHVPKFICAGLNYADHAAETNSPVPPEPILFSKATSAICGPNDDVIKPRGSTKLDWEVELGVVIGEETRYADEEEAARAIAGYCIVNDVSERAFQLERKGQWMKGKGCDTFGPIGPYLVTPDEIADPLDLRMTLSVNGRTYQDGSTRTMVFGPVFLISYISQFMTLMPGDVIATGTPPGVGMGQKPPVFLEPGDEMVLTIEGLGEQRQRVIGFADRR